VTHCVGLIFCENKCLIHSFYFSNSIKMPCIFVKNKFTMKYTLLFSILIMLASCGVTNDSSNVESADHQAVEVVQKTPGELEKYAKAYFASGCFWCVEATRLTDSSAQARQDIRRQSKSITTPKSSVLRRSLKSIMVRKTLPLLTVSILIMVRSIAPLFFMKMRRRKKSQKTLRQNLTLPANTISRLLQR